MTALLVVEDEDRIASFLVKGLRARGFAPTRAATGSEALALAEEQPFDLVLLDLGLPDMDGLEVLRRMRERSLTVPVIAVTARDSVRDKTRAFETGADDYLTKPFEFDELVLRIRARLKDER
ncbi:MAG TPA: response regulator [Egibacteraceae bacterium]|nr:response regulator [Egibacteraceae bacterium]